MRDVLVIRLEPPAQRPVIDLGVAGTPPIRISLTGIAPGILVVSTANEILRRVPPIAVHDVVNSRQLHAHQLTPRRPRPVPLLVVPQVRDHGTVRPRFYALPE